MSAEGHERRFDPLTIGSGLPPTSDISGSGRHFAFGPQTDVHPHPCQRGNWAEGLTEVSDLAHRADVTDRADNRSCGPGSEWYAGTVDKWLGKD
jgi:hypothetical protein